ncbi:hypothetical protein IWQ62_003641 [Dispira parvispora]|uniref:Uncharacterized protein n=1 Tax=Dispira parvispora TaxID=1520584 RepID=A0A9W8AN37_9FUNG|nr:hypothetical protein IWQ62_003641 [Dispira parvispora]
MVSCSTIWCVLLAIVLPTEVLSSGTPSDRHNVMKIDFLCGNSPNSHTEATNVERTDSGANIQSKSEIEERVDGILHGKAETVPGEYFDPRSKLHKNTVDSFKRFEESCDRDLLKGARNALERDLEKRIDFVFNTIEDILDNVKKRSTTLWVEKGDWLILPPQLQKYTGNDVIIAMIYQEMGKNEIQSKFVLIPNVPGYDCNYYKEHFQRQYEFVYAFPLPLGTDPRLTMTTFLREFAKYKAEVDGNLAA